MSSRNLALKSLHILFRTRFLCLGVVTAAGDFQSGQQESGMIVDIHKQASCLCDVCRLTQKECSRIFSGKKKKAGPIS